MDRSDACHWDAPHPADAGRTALARTAERLAAEHLGAVHGLEVVATNLRVAVEDLRGELDVVLRDRRSGSLVICEVKARTRAGGSGALEALGARQCARIRRMTAVLLADGTLRARSVRFDLVTFDVRHGGPRSSRLRTARLAHLAGAW